MRSIWLGTIDKSELRSESEYLCANDWIISGDAGPSPDDVANDLPCDISQIELECEKLFDSEILLPCLAKDTFELLFEKMTKLRLSK